MDIKVSVNINKIDKRNYPKKINKEQKRCPLLTKVKDYVKCVESDEESAKEWYYLEKLYNRLQDITKLTPEQEQIIYIIEPLLLKYSTNPKTIKGEKMLRGKDYEQMKKKDK